MAAFEASAISLDNGIAMVLDALEENGLAENTLVICTTDHGIAFPGAKGSLRDAGIGVMLIMRGPGGFSGGKVCDAMISQTDLFPTICDLLHIDPPAWLQGKSFLPIVQEQTDQIHDHIYAESNYHAAYEPQRAIRTARWKYIRRFDGRTRPVLPNTDDSLSKDAMLHAGWASQSFAEEQLYDLWFDPTETHNLIHDPAYATIREQLSSQMKQWMRNTDDPLYLGPVAAPPGAQLNDPDQLSPTDPVTIVQAQD
jgi:arylsulfatase A-like enzyme